MAWLTERGKSHSDPLTLDDLMDLGFDPDPAQRDHDRWRGVYL